jgi:hypothetical protein
MKTNRKIVLLASTALLLGGIFTIAQKASVSTSEQLVAECRGGGYPVLECDERGCQRRCPDPDEV